MFNPYSNVKTSILILDKTLAKKTNTLAFFKIENDGFDLGAQRREIDKNNLPQAQVEIGEYLRRLRAGESIVDFQPTLGLIVGKEKIIANGEYSLSEQKYQENVGVQQAVWPLVELNSIFDFLGKGERPASFASETGKFPFVVSSLVEKSCEVADYNIEALVIGDGGSANIHYFNGPFSASDHTYILKRKDHAQIIPKYVYELILANLDLIEIGFQGQGLKNVSKKYLTSIQIPLPSLEVQKDIVTEIEDLRKIINGARAVLDNYDSHIPFNPDWPFVKLGEHFETMGGGTPSKSEEKFWIGHIPWVSPKDMKTDFIEETEDYITEEAIKASTTKLISAGSVVCVVRSGILKHSFPVAILGKDMCINQDLLAFKPITDAVIPKFLFYVLKTKSPSIIENGIKSGVTVQSFYNGFFRDYLIPLPSIDTQQTIVAEIEAEQILVAANRELIARFEKKIQATLTRVWGENDQVLEKA